MPRQAVYPKGLAVRGKRLWREVLAIRPRLGPGERVLLEEACRIADRLEVLNDLIAGRKPPEVKVDGKRLVLVVDAAEQEARLSTIALRQVMMSLGLDKLPVPAPAEPPAQPEPAAPVKQPADGGDGGEAADPLDEITRRREARGRGAAG